MNWMSKNTYKSSLYIFIISLFIFLIKWILSFSYFPNEDLSIKIINDSYKDSYMYFHYIKSIADFNFQNTFHSLSNNEGLMSVPYGAVLIHAIFYKIFGISSFIFLELLSIFIFLNIIFLILNKLEFDFTIAIFLSLLAFFIPQIISYINYFEIVELNTFANYFYNLRFPRPLVANLFLFYFIYLLIEFHLDKSIKQKIIIKIVLIMGLSLSSFYFFFVTEIIAFLIVFLNKIRKNIVQISKELFLKLLIPSIIFSLLVFPFVYLVLNGSESYSERIGVIQIDFEDKIFLLKHYLHKLLTIKLLVLYTFFTFSFFLIRKFYSKSFEIVKVFYIIFLSSLLAPLIFIMLSGKIAFLYHFNNITVVCTVLLFIVILLVSLKHNLNLTFLNKKFSLLSLIFLIILTHNIYSFLSYDKKYDKKRIELNNVLKVLTEKKVDYKNLVILSFDRKVMTWAILNNIKDINVMDGTFSPRTSSLTDISLIESFKFLELQIPEFNDFIKNKKQGYRYINKDARLLYWQRYQANSLTTFEKSNDFDKEIIEHLMKSSPFYAHQFAIPNYEIKRLTEMFLNYKDQNFKKPNLIIINKDHDILKNSQIDMNKYCIVHNQKFLSAYLKKDLC